VISKESIKSLQDQGLIKSCPKDKKAIEGLLKRARIDIKTAKRNLKIDPECAYNYSYNAMMRCGLALMLNEGFRPDITNKHLTIVKFAYALMDNTFKKIINDYDFMRRKRHRFLYEPAIPCSLKEAQDALHTAEAFLELASKLIKGSG
jgi:uncharacterized protein (UPF0332 family)